MLGADLFSLKIIRRDGAGKIYGKRGKSPAIKIIRGEKGKD